MKIFNVLLVCSVVSTFAAIPMGYVTLTNKNSNKVFSPKDGNPANGTNIVQYDYAALDQEWKLVEVETGFYAIENRVTGKVLDVENQSNDDGANVQQWHFSGVPGQLWSIEEDAGAYRIINKKSGKILSVESESVADGGNIHQWSDGAGDSQLWDIAHVAGAISATPFSETVYSPDGKAEITFELINGSLFYSVAYNNTPIVNRSGLGFYVKESAPLVSFGLVNSTNAVIDEVWEPVWGYDSLVHNHGNELTIDLKEDVDSGRELSLVFRAYNDGVAFKYLFPESMGSFDIMSEETYFNFADDSRTWWIQDQWFSYEDIYFDTKLSEVTGANTPLTMKSTEGIYYSIHEADLTDYAGMTFMPTGGPLSFKSELVPWADGTKVKVTAPHQSPWRTIMLAERSGDLMESHMIQNLNDPNEIEDTSWIKPTKYIGIWWGMHMGEFTWDPGSKHGATTENAKTYIDYAADFGMDGVLIEGWNLGWSSPGWSEMDFTKAYDDFDIDAVTEYAASKGVFLIGHHETGANIIGGQYAYDDQLEAALDFYESKGVPAIKTGYVGEEALASPKGENKHGQLIVRHYQRVIEEAAKRNIMINAHEPIKGTGIDRTWPNFIAREGVRGNEYNAWGAPINPPDHAVVIPFTRILSGPVDFTPGVFNLDNFGDGQANSTIAKQLAMYVVFYSPLQMAADLPRNYVGNPAFQFIRNVPLNWTKTKVIESEIGDHVTVARKNGNNWYIGSITDENSRSVSYSVDFLVPGAEYEMTIYVDAADTDYQSKPHSIDITTKTAMITSESIISYDLKACGGAAIELVHKTGPVVDPRDTVPTVMSSSERVSSSVVIEVSSSSVGISSSLTRSSSGHIVYDSSDEPISSEVTGLFGRGSLLGSGSSMIVNSVNYKNGLITVSNSAKEYSVYTLYGSVIKSGVVSAGAITLPQSVQGVVVIRYK
ncbi:MAG: glycoside hydrolase family 97 catalytic domain-containing protein [Fibrobacterales bacterium]